MLARTRGGSAQGKKCQAPTLICGRSRPGASGSPTISLARSGAQTWIELLGGHGSPGRLVPATWPPGGPPTPRGSSQKNQLAFLRGAPRAHRQGMGHRTSPKFGQHALPLGTVVESEPLVLRLSPRACAFCAKARETPRLPAAFPGARAHAPCCSPSRALRGVSPSPRDAVPCALSSPVPQTPFPPAVPAALTGPRLDWEQPPLRTLSAEHVDVLAEMVPSRTGKSSLNRRTRLAEPPRDWGHHRFFSGRRATGDQSWVPMAGRRTSGSAKDHASGGSSAGRGGRPGPPGQFWNVRPVRWARTTKSGRTPPSEYVAITSLLFFCISNLFREQERYLTIT